MTHLQEEWSKLSIKDMVCYLLTVVTMIAGFVLLFMGMLLPPEGEIHHSVLTAFGMVCIFAASLLGISLHYNRELTNFKAEVENMIKKQ